jgi:alpha-N-arabinofuranosidase
VKGTIGVDKPSVSSGSDTYPLDVAAALTDDHKMVTVAVVNPTESVHELNLNLKGSKFRDDVKLFRLAVPEIKTDKRFGQEPAFENVELILKNTGENWRITPFSISLYVFEIK